MKTLYILKGQPGTGKSSFLAKIVERGQMMGIDIETYHSTLEPEKLDLVILPELETALVISSEHYPYTPEFRGTIIPLDFEASLNSKGLEAYLEDIASCRTRISSSIERALQNSLRAKKLHDLLETYYIPAMNFEVIEKKRISVLQSILDMASEKAIAVNLKVTSNSKDI